MAKAAETAIVVMGLFSIWIWIALVVINALGSLPPAYAVGSPCIWDLAALLVAGLGGALWIPRWPASRRTSAVAWTAVSYMALFALLFLAGHPSGRVAS